MLPDYLIVHCSYHTHSRKLSMFSNSFFYSSIFEVESHSRLLSKLIFIIHNTSISGHVMLLDVYKWRECHIIQLVSVLCMLLLPMLYSVDFS